MEVTADVAVNLATKDDVRKAAKEILFRPYRARIQVGRDGNTDSGGNATLRVYDVPDGKTFFLYKLILVVSGVNPGSFATLGSNPGMGIYHGQSGGLGALADFGPTATNSFFLPCTFEYNSHTAPEFRSGDSMSVQLFNCMVSSNFAVLAWGELYELTNVKNY